MRHTYVAVNFIDIDYLTGRYPLPLPNGLGSDAVGWSMRWAPASRMRRWATEWAT